jgi:hypothetical protein
MAFRCLPLVYLLRKVAMGWIQHSSTCCQVHVDSCRCAGWINIVDVWAHSVLVVSGALCSLDGEKAEVLSTPCTIPDVGSERSFQFSPMVEIARC